MGDLVQLKGVTKTYDTPNGPLHAVSDVDLAVPEGSTLGVVGESGSGKSTLAAMIVGLLTPTRGTITVGGLDVSQTSARRRAPLCQMVFQSAASALNPRIRVGRSVEEPLAIHRPDKPRSWRRGEALRLMERVGLTETVFDRYPHQLSGGQRQRIGIARALALSPKVLVADEPVSALDVSVRAQVLNLLADLQSSLGLTLILISHDLSVVEWIADRIVVMYAGKIMESGPAGLVVSHPIHPYTRALSAAIPRIGVNLSQSADVLIEDAAPPPAPGPCCPLFSRCPDVQPVCSRESPTLESAGGDRLSACHLTHLVDHGAEG